MDATEPASDLEEKIYTDSAPSLKLVSEVVLLLAEFCPRLTKMLGKCSVNPPQDAQDRVKRKLSWDLYRLGPKVKNTFWADAVRVGGNYVRHHEEWRVFPYEMVAHQGQQRLLAILEKYS